MVQLSAVGSDVTCSLSSRTQIRVYSFSKPFPRWARSVERDQRLTGHEEKPQPSPT
jgi:hypothetical protein